MPTYVYRGTDCSHAFEVHQSFSDDPLTECTVCGKPVRRVFQPTGLVFKGSGWYINDSRKTSPETDTDATSSTTDADSGKDTTEKPAAESTKQKEPATASVASNSKD